MWLERHVSVTQYGGSLLTGVTGEDSCRQYCLLSPHCAAVDFHKAEASCWLHQDLNLALVSPNPCCHQHRRMEGCLPKEGIIIVMLHTFEYAHVGFLYKIKEWVRSGKYICATNRHAYAYFFSVICEEFAMNSYLSRVMGRFCVTDLITVRTNYWRGKDELVDPRARPSSSLALVPMMRPYHNFYLNKFHNAITIYCCCILHTYCLF